MGEIVSMKHWVLQPSMRLIVGIVTALATSIGNIASAVEPDTYDSMSPTDDQMLKLAPVGRISTDLWLGRFHLGGWPEDAIVPPPPIEPHLTIRQGMIENGDWANPFLLRLDPASYLWLTNLSAHAESRYSEIGSGKILIAFDRNICSIGVMFAQTGAHNRHHPDLRRTTGFSFFSREGFLIDRLDVRPGTFAVKTGFSTEPGDPPIWAMLMESEVSIAVIELIAMECTLSIG